MDIKLEEISEGLFNERYTKSAVIGRHFVDQELEFIIEHHRATDSVSIYNSYFRSLTIGTHHPNSLLVFSNCIIENLFFAPSIKNCIEVKLINCIINNLSSNEAVKSIKIENNELKDKLILPDNFKYEKTDKAKYDIILRAKGSCKIEGIKCDSISTRDLDEHSSEITITNVRCETLNLKSKAELVVVSSKIKVSNLHGSRSILYNNCNADDISITAVSDSFEAMDSEIEKLSVEKLVVDIIVFGSTIKKLLGGFLSTNLRKLRIESSSSKRSKIGELTFEAQIPKMNVKSSDIENLTIINCHFLNDCKFEFEDVEFGHLKIVDSEINNSKFSRIRFSNSGKALTLQNSYLTRGNFHAIQWPSNYRINEIEVDYHDLDKRNYLWNIREAYRQLKIISVEAHNKIDASRFLQQEVRMYYRFVHYLTWRVSLKDWWNYVADWLVLFTNKVFSNFGESWFRPLCWLLIFHFLFVWSFLDQYGMEINIRGEANWDGVRLFLKTLSPIHSFDMKIGDIKDFFMRISSSYFIFYIIKGTRKFHFNV
jgi:hypothetical protein